MLSHLDALSHYFLFPLSGTIMVDSIGCQVGVMWVKTKNCLNLMLLRQIAYSFRLENEPCTWHEHFSEKACHAHKKEFIMSQMTLLVKSLQVVFTGFLVCKAVFILVSLWKGHQKSKT